MKKDELQKYWDEKNGVDRKESDHDLLVELRTEMRAVRNDLKDIKEGTSKDIADLKKDKADRVEVDKLQKVIDEDIEKRMQAVENSQVKIYAWASCIAFIISLGIAYFTHK